MMTRGLLRKLNKLFYNKLNAVETERLENEIDEMIFSLYGLTSSERATISGDVLPSMLSEELINFMSVSDNE